MNLYDVVKEEIQSEPNMGCLIMDLSAYFPFIDQEVCELEFRYWFENGEFVQPSDYRLNHRFNNISYRTLTKKYGRRVSRLGYPIFVSLKNAKERTFFLELKFCLNHSWYKSEFYMLLPMKLNMTEEKPVVFLEIRYLMDEMENEEDDESWYLEILERGKLSADHRSKTKDVVWSMRYDNREEDIERRHIELIPLYLKMTEDTHDETSNSDVKKYKAKNVLNLHPQTREQILYYYDRLIG